MVQRAGALLVLVLLIAAASAHAGPNMKEGLWEVTVRMEMAGMPGMPSMKHVQCMTKEEMVPQRHGEEEKDCRITKQKIKGDTVVWDASCDTPEGVMRFHGEVTYSGDSFSGTLKMKGSDGEPMEMTQHISGVWIGECKR